MVTMADEANKAYVLGVADYMNKPVNYSRLARLIQGTHQLATLADERRG
jgi:response regulator of citrate/malate metabolism